jgi:arylsulfatase
MAAHAGLIYRLDQEIGRLVDDVRQAGELDDTLILFFSDNGACPFGRSIAETGEPYEPDTNWGCDTGWAWARNSPFRFYKQDQYEGGIATPGIAHWPSGLRTKPGSIDATPAHLVDVLPTLLDISGTKRPGSWPGRTLSSISGISLAPILAGGKVTRPAPIHLQFGPNRGLRDGDWKLVSFGSGPWELYHLATDRAELHDVAAEHPEIRDRMSEAWHRMAANELHIPERLAGAEGKKAGAHRNPKWTDYDRSVTEAAANKRKSPGKKAKTTSE